MAIIRLYTGADGQSHFEELTPRFEPRSDQSETAELLPGRGITIRRFDAKRSNPWHHAPGRAAVFTLSGAVDVEVGDGSVRRLGPGDVLIAEDLTATSRARLAPSPACRSSCRWGRRSRRRGGLFDWVPDQDAARLRSETSRDISNHNATDITPSTRANVLNPRPRDTALLPSLTGVSRMTRYPGGGNWPVRSTLAPNTQR